MEFLNIFVNVAAKNRVFGSNIIFLQQNFRFGGGSRSISPDPGGAYARICDEIE